MPSRLAPVILLASLLSACGDDGESSQPEGPIKIDGPFLKVFGAQQKTILWSAAGAQIVCRPKPGLQEFEYEATVDSDSFKLVLKDYAATKSSYDIEYKVEVGTEPHVVDVTFGTDYKYKFFQSFRTDIDEAFNSQCSINLVAEELVSATRYQGTMFCVMLWADTTSNDYRTDIVNNYIDLVAKFECEY
jgi:hypothetical protein